MKIEEIFEYSFFFFVYQSLMIRVLRTGKNPRGGEKRGEKEKSVAGREERRNNFACFFFLFFF